jgi:signal transduction histidine kinase/PAS domain-containing protein
MKDTLSKKGEADMDTDLNHTSQEHVSIYQFILSLTAAIFLSESLVFLLMRWLHPEEEFRQALLDATFTAILILPILYFISYKPLLTHIMRRRRAEQALQQAHRELAERVEERTAELRQTNQALQKEVAERKRVEANLESERKRLFSLLEELPAIVYLQAPDYSIRFANRMFREKFGDPQNQLCYQIIHQRASPCEDCPTMTVLDKQDLVHWEWNLLDGTSYQLYDYPFVDMDGTELVLEMGIDITQRKQAESWLEAKNQELLVLSHELRNQRDFAEGLVQAVLALNTSLDLDEVLDRILIQIQRVIPYDLAGIFLLEGENIFLARHHGFEISPETLDFLKAGFSLEMLPLLKKASEDKMPALVPDTHLSSDWKGLPGLEWTRSYSSVSLLSNAKVIGIISLLSDQTDGFTGETVRYLEAFANHAMLAIQNARLFQDEQLARQTAEVLRSASLALTQSLDLDIVLSTLLEYLNRLIPFDSASVSLLEDEARLSVKAARGYENWTDPDLLSDLSFDIQTAPNFRTLVESQEPLLVENCLAYPGWEVPPALAHVRSWLGVPMVSGGHVTGVCSLDHTQTGFFTQHQVKLVEALVSQAAVTIENAWLFEQVRAGRHRLLALSHRLVEIQENERRYVARELHDEASQALTSLLVGMSLVERQIDEPEAALKGIAHLKRTVDGVMENLHRLAMDLRPVSLDHLGLEAALRQHIQSISSTQNLDIQLEKVGLPERLPAEIETALYRIVQEALTNAVRHARATRVDILLEYLNNRLVVVIEDDGVGFDPDEVQRGSRLGVFGMQERAEMLGGKLWIESFPGKGTTIQVEVPYVAANTAG